MMVLTSTRIDSYHPNAEGKDHEIVIEQNDTLLNFVEQIEAASATSNATDYGEVTSGGTYTGTKTPVTFSKS